MSTRRKLSSHGRTEMDRFREILFRAVSAGPAMVSITDAEGRFVFVNDRYVELTGYSRRELIGKPSSVLKSGLARRNRYRELWDTIRGGREWRGEFRNRRKDGTNFWESALVVPIADERGRISHYLKTAEDISAYKRAERQLRASNGRLAEQTRMLKNACARLAEAKRALEKSERKLRHLSLVDSLTGLLNRRGFERDFRRTAALCRRHGRGLGLLLMDIDHFKRINDRHGHDMGDIVLRECAVRLRAGLRASDILCRYGGDEMIVLLPLVSASETAAAAERLRVVVRGRPFGSADLKVRVTLSVGAVWAAPDSRATDRGLTTQADRALYESKQGGRDRVTFHPNRSS